MNFFLQYKHLRFGKKKAAKEELYGTKKPIKIQDVDVDNIVISNLVKRTILSIDWIFR